MKTRVDLEDMLMKCWHVTDDIELVITIMEDMELSAKDQDKLMNILIGMKELYNIRFSDTFGVFEDLVKQQYFEKPAPKRSQEFFPHD